jgi:hypothetical protein
MAITAVVSSSLPIVDGYYYQEGNTPIPVNIFVYNSDPVAVQLKQLYLTETSSSLGTGASLSLGEPVFRYISSTPNTTNNIIPAGGTGSYSALFVPQVNALTTFPTDYYLFSLTAVVQQFGYAETIRATPAPFAVAPSPNSVYALINNYQVWSQYDNKRPPQYIGFDYLLGAQQKLLSGEYVSLPINELYFSSSNPLVASVVEHTDILNSTTGSVNGVSQISSSGGSVSIVGVGTTNFAVRRFSNSSPVIASGSLEVVDALPVALEITLPIENFFFSVPTQPTGQRLLSFKATLVKSNGSRVDVSNNNIWSVSSTSILQNLRFITGRWQDFQINPNSPVNEFGYTRLQITAKYQGLTATAFMNAIIRAS